MKNKYSSRSKISEAKVRQIVRLFALDLNALQIASLAGLNRNTVNRYLNAFRERIARFCESHSPFKAGIAKENITQDLPADESTITLKSKNTNGKSLLFGLLGQNGRVYTEVVPEESKATLQGIIRGRVTPESVIHSDGWRGYDSIVDMGKQKYIRVEQRNRKRAPVNGTESFWAYTKTRLLQFRGLRTKSFYFHMKECEFRFNHRDDDIYQLVLKMLRDEPLCQA